VHKNASTTIQRISGFNICRLKMYLSDCSSNASACFTSDYNKTTNARHLLVFLNKNILC